jgi:ubiquinol-cytochrome c reductase iron-sulfur subunit
MLPSERAKAAGAPVEVDISKLGPGQMMTVEWRGKPVWIINRTKEMLDSLAKIGDQLADPKSDKNMQPEYAKNDTRSIKPEILVAVGICTHLGCSPTEKFKTGCRVRASIPTGRADSSAPATVPPSTSPVASTRASRRRTTSKSHRTCTLATPS